MKILCQFEVNKEMEVDESETRQEDGKDVTVIKKIKKQIPIKFFLMKPSRSLEERGKMYHSVAVSRGITAGLITRALLAKRIVNDGGLLSEPEREQFKKITDQLFEKRTELRAILQKEDKARSEEENKRTPVVTNEIIKLQNSLQSFEIEQSALFSHTAEAQATEKTMFWWTIQLAYTQEEGDKEPKPLFTGDTDEEKIASFDKLTEENEAFYIKVIKKLGFYIPLWYGGHANKPEDFSEIEKELGLV